MPIDSSVPVSIFDKDTPVPLHVSGDKLFGTCGFDLYMSSDYGQSFERRATCPVAFWRRLIASHPLSLRVMREGFHNLEVLPNGGLLGSIRGSIVYCGPDEDYFSRVFESYRGSRPFNLCVDPTGKAYFGEYFPNSDRDEVHIFGSENGLEEWFSVYTFPPSKIRHVHGIYYDRHRKGHWVTTGDDDCESALWFSSDEFSSLDCVIGGSQRSRSAAIIPRKEDILVPTDTPRIGNVIQKLEPWSGDIRQLHEIDGSAFYAENVSGMYFVTTVHEPRSESDHECAILYGSTDGIDWKHITSFEWDLKLFRGVSRYPNIMRFPELTLPSGLNSTPFLFARGIALDGADNRMIRWKLDDIRDYLTR